MGLVTQLVPAQRLLDEAVELARADRAERPDLAATGEAGDRRRVPPAARGGARAREPAVPGLPRHEGPASRRSARSRRSGRRSSPASDPAKAGRARHVMDADGTPGGGAARPESPDERIERELSRVQGGGAEKYHAKNAEQGKLFVRERLDLLLDPGSFVEDGALANALDPELPADGVVTGMGRVGGRPVCVMANDSTVKAGSWGARTVEKILRIQEVARRAEGPHAVPRRLRRRAHHRPGGDVPGPARRREDLPQRGPPLRRGPAGLSALRPVGGRRRLHPGLLRRRRHGGGERLHVPRLAADGRDGHR